MTIFEENLDLERRLREVTAERDQLRELVASLYMGLDEEWIKYPRNEEIAGAAYQIVLAQTSLHSAALAPTHDQE